MNDLAVAAMRSHAVDRASRAAWSDDKPVRRIAEAAIGQSKCGFDAQCINRINDDDLVPCCEILASRGSAALRKLLALLDHDNPNVRLNAASFAFAEDPARCRRALKALLQQGGLMSLCALAVWSHHDPDTAPDPTALLDNLPQDWR